MQRLEAASEAAYAAHGDQAREFVALGFIADWDETNVLDGDGRLVQAYSEPDIVWYELPNQAGVGEFLVDGEDVLAVVQRAQAEGHENGLGRILWHSHYRSQEPSDSDIKEFPAWLVDYGIVYHAPTQQSMVYNSGGIISAMPDVQATLATGA